LANRPVGLAVIIDIAIVLGRASSPEGRRLVLPFGGCLLVMSACAAVAVRQQLASPAIALDADSLELDRRLRWDDARSLMMSFAGLPLTLSGVGHALATLCGPWFLIGPAPILLVTASNVTTMGKQPPPARTPAPAVGVS
jgi:hypothetical protein